MRPARALLTAPEPLRWVFTGDSITHGAVHTSGARDYVELFAEHLRWDLGRRRDHVITTGVSGRRIDDLELDLDWSVLQYRPHVVSLMFGLNDCVADGAEVGGFAASYRRVIRSIQDAGATVVLHTPNRVIATDPERRASLPAYVEAVRALASESDAALVDHDADWRAADEAGAVEYWIDHGCHPNAAGHRVLARGLLRTLDGWDPASPIARLYVPAVEYLPD